MYVLDEECSEVSEIHKSRIWPSPDRPWSRDNRLKREKRIDWMIWSVIKMTGCLIRKHVGNTICISHSFVRKTSSSFLSAARAWALNSLPNSVNIVPIRRNRFGLIERSASLIDSWVIVARGLRALGGGRRKRRARPSPNCTFGEGTTKLIRKSVVNTIRILIERNLLSQLLSFIFGARSRQSEYASNIESISAGC
jgi:hypothetical protein